MEQPRENANAIPNKSVVDQNFQEFYDNLCMEPIKPPVQMEEETKNVTSPFSNKKDEPPKESQKEDLKADSKTDTNSWAIAKEKYKLGVNYLLGKGGCVPNSKKAFTLFKEASKLNHIQAQYSLGYLYLTGKGCKQSPKKAVKWITLSAAGGDKKANEVLKAIAGLSPIMMSCLYYGWYPDNRKCILQ